MHYTAGKCYDWLKKGRKRSCARTCQMIIDKWHLKSSSFGLSVRFCCLTLNYVTEEQLPLHRSCNLNSPVTWPSSTFKRINPRLPDDIPGSAFCEMTGHFGLALAPFGQGMRWRRLWKERPQWSWQLHGFGFVSLAAVSWRWSRESLWKKKKKKRVAEGYTQKLRCLNLDCQVHFLSKDNVITQNLLIVLMNVVREKGMVGKDSLGKVFYFE